MVSLKGKQAAGGAACLMLFASLLSRQIFADETHKATFNASFLRNMTGLDTDVTRFSTGNPVEPGKYMLDVYLNGDRIGTDEVKVVRDAGGVKTCFPYALLKKLPLRKGVLAEEKLQRLKPEQNCVAFSALFTEGNLRLNTADLRMDITLPQASLMRNARDFVSPEMWETGANALNFSYNMNAYRSVSNHQQYDSVYAKALLGFNVNGWMFRHDGYFNWQNQNRNGRAYRNIATYVQKDIPSLKSRLLLGEGNTSGDLFDTLSFRGVQLSSVEKMWPDSLRGYAPEIRGIASSTAQVIVSQNGTKLYETTVSPGAFLIDDLYPTGYGGDLEVTVKEADGSEKHFSVPYTALTRLKRPGMTSYAIAAGQSRIENLVYTPKMLQATIQHGFNNIFTGYTGILGTDNAASLLLGTAVGLPVGAFSVDVTQARTKYGSEKDKGTNIRATWSKKITATGTNLMVTASRSTAGYFSYNDAIHLNNNVKKGKGSLTLYRTKERLSLTARQQLGSSYGSLYASGYLQNYWNRSGSNTQFQLGYGGQAGRMTYNLAVNRLFYTTGAAETAFTLDFSIPLSSMLSSHHHYLSSSATYGEDGFRAQSMVNGTLGKFNQYSYNVGVSRDSDRQYAGNFGGQYRSPWTSLQTAWTKGEDYYSASAGLSGSMVMMTDSFTLSAYQATTLAVIDAENAKGAHVAGHPDIFLNSSGRAIIPNLSPYRINELSIDPKGLPTDVELKQTTQRVVPVEGAIMKVTYKSVSGRPLLLRARLPDGGPLPFGASVSNEKGETLASVMQGGQIYLRLNQDNIKLLVSWGSSQEKSCSINVTADDLKASKNSSLTQLSAKCI